MEQDDENLRSCGGDEDEMFVEPKYPLPEALSTMPQDDTVCQYCGIPYLIHSEVSRMKKRVAELESDLVEHKLMEQDLQRLQQESVDYRMSLDKALYDCQILRSENSTLTATIDGMTQQLTALQSQIDKLCADYEKQLAVAAKDLENSRADFRTLQDENNQEIKELKMKMALAADHAKLEAMRLADRQCDALQVELREKYEQEMADMQTRFVSEQEKFKTLLAEFELFKLLSAKEMEQQQIESEEKSTKIKELILRNEKSEIVCDKLEKSLQQARNDVTDQREECRKLRCKLEVLSQEKQRDGEKLKGEIISLRQEMDNAIGQMGSEKEGQLKKLKERVTATENDLILAKRTIREMEVDRDKTIEAHQNRIKDLQDHFKEELARTCLTEVQTNLDELRRKLEHEHESKLEHEKTKIRMEFEMQVKELQETIEDRDLDLISIKDTLKYHQNRSREVEENVTAEYENKLQEHQEEIKRLRRIIDGRKAAEEIQRIVGEKDKQIEALKRTVHRECEERNNLLVRLKNLIDAKNNTNNSLPTLISPMDMGVTTRAQRTSSILNRK